MEEWRTIRFIDGDTSYEVSNLGRVRRVGHRILAGTPNGKRGQYRRIAIRQRLIFIHRLVADAFIGHCPTGYQINHKDGNGSNNSVENLEYVTAKENQQHSWRELGRKAPRKGTEVTNFAKLSDTDVIHIRRMRAEGKTYREIASHFNTKPANVWHICQGRTWKHLIG